MLLDRLPPFLRGIYEFQIINNACEQPEADSLWQRLEETLNDQFIETAAESGIERLEKICGISPKAEDSLEDRRFRLSSIYIENRPTTLIFLKKQLEQLCGPGNYSISVNNAGYTLTVKVALVSKASLNAVKELITKIKPANIAADIDLLYNRYKAYTGSTHIQMHAHTHETLRSEVI